MINTDTLRQLSEIIKIKVLCELAEIPYQNIVSKIRRDKSITVHESEQLEKVLKRFNIKIEGEDEKAKK